MTMNVMYRSRRVVVATGLAATTLVLPAAAAAAPIPALPCQVTALPLPVGLSDGTVTAADPSGRWQAGTAQDGNGAAHLVRWDGGTPQDLGTSYPWPAAINSSGDMIGSSTTGTVSQPWRYHDGQFLALPPLHDGDTITTVALNDTGAAAGTSTDPDGIPQIPVVWPATGAVSALPLPAGDNTGQPAGVDTDGSIVGMVGFDPHDTSPWQAHPVAWQPDGTVVPLAAPADDPDAGLTPLAIDGGIITGNRQSDSGTWSVWQWATSTATPAAVTTGQATAASTTGALAVRVDGTTAVLWHDGTTQNLPIPNPDPSMLPWSLTAVTDTDTVYGYANDVNGTAQNTPLRWNCS